VRWIHRSVSLIQSMIRRTQKWPAIVRPSKSS
jgi:hypothetical protein